MSPTATVHPATHPRGPETHLHPRRSTGRTRYNFTNEAAAGAILSLCLLLGALAMLPVSADVVRLWLDDPLRSFGALLPPVAIVLWVRRWRALRWYGGGSAWGLLPMAAAILVARTYGASLIAYSFGTAEVAPLQPGFLLFLYGSGVALLLGGTRLWRAVLFPLGLLLCINPVPHLFDKLDAPLQTASAEVTRAFAHALGLHPTGVQLQMMFAPRFGLVIVPGCNGVRGSATMAYLALLLGYLRRLRWQRTAAYAVAGLLLGYLLNFMRLCCLVVYYRAAMNHPQWHASGETVDYLIGGTLFLLITALAGFLLLRPAGQADASLRDSSTENTGTRPPARAEWSGLLRPLRILIAAVLLLAAAGSELPAVWAAITSPDDYLSPAFATAQTPQLAGPWQRERVWTEVYDGRAVWLWSSYRRSDGRTLDMGVWLSPKRHYGIQSLLMNGSHPLAGGGFTATSRDSLPMQLFSYTLTDGMTDDGSLVPTLFAETMCLPDHCSEQALGFKRKGWLVALSPMAAREQRRLPLLWRVQGPAGSQENAIFERDAEILIADFTGILQVRPMVERMGSMNAYRN